MGADESQRTPIGTLWTKPPTNSTPIDQAVPPDPYAPTAPAPLPAAPVAPVPNTQELQRQELEQARQRQETARLMERFDAEEIRVEPNIAKLGERKPKTPSQLGQESEQFAAGLKTKGGGAGGGLATPAQVGEHEVETAFRSSPRHSLGRGLPPNHPLANQEE